MNGEETEIAEEFVPALQAPIAGALSPTPYNFEFTGEDQLRLTVYNYLAGAVVAVHYRMKRPDGTVIANAQRLAASSDRQATTLEFGIGAGYLLNAVVYVVTGAPRLGMTFARLQVLRGGGAAATVLGTILQGYVTSGHSLGWPGSPLESSLASHGVLSAVVGTLPAPSTEINEVVPAGAQWELVSLVAELTTTAAVADRQVHLRTDDGTGGNPTVLIPAMVVQAASRFVRYVFGQGLPYAQIEPQVAQTIPLVQNISLTAGHRVRTATGNMQAGDQWSQPRYLIRQWMEVI